jgi:hypothetical protein
MVLFFFSALPKVCCSSSFLQRHIQYTVFAGTHDGGHELKKSPDKPRREGESQTWWSQFLQAKRSTFWSLSSLGYNMLLLPLKKEDPLIKSITQTRNNKESLAAAYHSRQNFMALMAAAGAGWGPS